MRLGWFRPVHCKSLPAQEVRALLTARKLLQGLVTGCSHHRADRAEGNTPSYDRIAAMLPFQGG